MVDGVSPIFADYEREFASTLASVKQHVDASSASGAPVGTASAGLDAADRDLGEASELLQSMTLEVASLSPAARASCGAKLDAMRASAAGTKSALRAARIALAERRGDADRTALLGRRQEGERDLEAGFDEDERARLAETTRKLQDGSDRILDSRRNIAQTEAIASNILSDLAQQRATIQRARNNLGVVDDGLTESNAILSQMNRRALMNKLVIYGIFAFISVVIMWILYSKLFKRGT